MHALLLGKNNGLSFIIYFETNKVHMQQRNDWGKNLNPFKYLQHYNDMEMGGYVTTV